MVNSSIIKVENVASLVVHDIDITYFGDYDHFIFTKKSSLIADNLRFDINSFNQGVF